MAELEAELHIYQTHTFWWYPWLPKVEYRKLVYSRSLTVDEPLDEYFGVHASWMMGSDYTLSGFKYDPKVIHVP